MPTTMDLLAEALEKKKAAHWCRELNLDPTALTQAKKRKHLSPAIAASIAMVLGADPMKWAAISGIEADANQGLKDRLMNNGDLWRKLSLPPVGYVVRMLQQRAGVRFVFAINRALDYGRMAVKYQCKRVQRIHAGRP